MRIRSCALALVPVLLLPASALAEGDAEAVRRAFSAYRSALLAGEGEAAAALLSRSTYDYYDEMRRLALYGDAAAVEAQSLMNQLQILMLRLRMPADELESLSPAELIAHAVDQGWIGKESVLGIQPGKALAEGDVAVLHVQIDGNEVAPGFQFRRESGAWRLDLVPVTQAGNAALQMAARQQGLSEREFLLLLIESVLGRKIGSEAWVPPRSVSQE